MLSTTKIWSTPYFYQQKAFGGGVISIKLIHFENTLNRLPDGTCCDGWSTSKGKCHTCEYFFTFCISDINNRACSLKQMTTDIMSWTEYYAFEEFLFLAPYGDEIKNPIQLQFTSWNVSIYVLSMKYYVQISLNWIHVFNLNGIWVSMFSVTIISSTKSNIISAWS